MHSAQYVHATGGESDRDACAAHPTVLDMALCSQPVQGATLAKLRHLGYEVYRRLNSSTIASGDTQVAPDTVEELNVAGGEVRGHPTAVKGLITGDYIPQTDDIIGLAPIHATGYLETTGLAWSENNTLRNSFYA
ncbi:hypothetical protein J6590_031354 [Homalodisca vitripennis]|nr:hypothetical protein J6590_031354 [Homalodisca vitripennis]